MICSSESLLFVITFFSFIFIFQIESVNSSGNYLWSRFNLPDEQIPYFFFSNPRIKKKCAKDDTCPYKEHLNSTKCYGYERKCDPKDRTFLVKCSEDSRGWAKTKQEQIDGFWNYGDFGYVKRRINELKVYCTGTEPDDSSLECVDHTRMCRARNIMFDFKHLKSKNVYDQYREDVIQPGDVGGHCKLNGDEFKKQGSQKSPLQSWFAELGHFQELDYKPISDDKCDVVIKEPSFVIKLDAGINMYHHFCDFVNLYLTQHVNNSFLQNVNVVIWDTSDRDYWSYFSDTWKVFTNRKLIHIKKFDGKRVCFRDAVFSLLARMRYGHFYNMPLVDGCHSTALYRSFSKYALHRLKIKQNGPLKDKIRVTMLARGTQFRNVLNEDKIVKALKSKLGKEIELKLVKYSAETPFVDQLQQTYDSDIFMGMHGAGLTHLLFLPNWATVFEIYNCDDRDCYYDLARLRGVKYYTWENDNKLVQQDDGKHPQLGTPHKKFTNYSFDPDEFVRMVKKMVKYVKEHPEFIAARNTKYPEATKNDEL